MYEGPGTAGYVSTWHDACEETRELALAYDMIYPALAGDTALVDFLATQAQRYGLENPQSLHRRHHPQYRKSHPPRCPGQP